MRFYYVRVLSVLACSLFPIASAAPLLAQGSPTLRNKTAEVDRIIARAISPGGVRVILTLRGATPDPAAAPAPSTSASTQQPSSPPTSGPLGDGQVATAEQAHNLMNYLGSDTAKRQRWAPRLIRNTPFMAMTVTMPELEALAADQNVVVFMRTANSALVFPTAFRLSTCPRLIAGRNWIESRRRHTRYGGRIRSRLPDASSYPGDVLLNG